MLILDVSPSQVDCFSFGMFLYEMIMLKLPFDGEGSALGGANLKVHIMAGGRPIITHKVKGYSLSAGKRLGDYEKKLR